MHGPFLLSTCNINHRKENAAILNSQNCGDFSPEDLKTFIEQSLDADKGFDIQTIDLRGESAIADYMIIASGTSSRHVAALAEKMKIRLESRGVDNVRTEGLSQSDWVVIDAGDVIIHVFRPEVRSFYNIEKMWNSHNGMEIIGREATA